MKPQQTKELISNIFAEAIGFLRISMVFSLKMVHMYWNMLEKLI